MGGGRVNGSSFDRADPSGRLCFVPGVRIAGYRAHSLIHALAPYVLAYPRFTIHDATGAIGGTHASIGRAVKAMVACEILEDAGPMGQEHLYQAPDALTVFDKGWRSGVPT